VFNRAQIVPRLLLRRALRRPQTADLLIAFSAHLIATPPMPKSKTLRDSYATRPTKSDLTLIESWRILFRRLLKEVSDEPTWIAQKRRLLWQLATEYGWIALFELVKEDDNVDSWKGFVENVDSFKDIELEDYYGMLYGRYLFALLTFAVLFTIGTAPYGLTSVNKQSLDFYKANGKDYILTVLGLHRGYYEIHRELGYEASEQYINTVLVLQQFVEELIKYNRTLLNRVVDETMDFNVLQHELDELEVKKKAARAIAAGQAPESFGNSGSTATVVARQ
jgi:hypothetical protein